MARSKPYTLRLAILDAFLLIFTAGGWVVYMAVRELYRRQ